MPELNWTEEVAYTLEYEGSSYREILLVNGIDGKRYRRPGAIFGNTNIVPTTHESTGDAFQELTAELVGSRVTEDNDWITEAELLYQLPDTGKYLFVNFTLDKYEGATIFNFPASSY